MKKFIAAYVIFGLMYLGTNAQQEAQFSFYMFNQLAYNPGYTGIREAICLNTDVRQQWIGYTDMEGNKVAPQTYLFTIDAAINKINSGIGLNIMQDKIGFYTNTGVKLSYAYRVPIGPGKLGIGLQGGFYNQQIDFNKFIFHDKDDPLLMSKAVESDMLLDFAGGLYYNMPTFFCGLSSTQLSEPNFKSSNNLAEPKLKRHYFFTAGYHYDLSPEFKISPSVLIKSDMASTQYDINGIVTYNNKFWGGLTYRPQDAATVMVGLNILEDFRFGYSYDITTSAIGANKRSDGTHEITLSYCFKIVMPVYHQSHRTVRFL